jgi:hypothetical protein
MGFHHRPLDCCLGMIFSENRCALFPIMLSAAIKAPLLWRTNTPCGDGVA